MPPGEDSVSSSPGTSPAGHSRIPLVTIGMPVRNGAQYLEEAIASLQAQTKRDFILHVSDNYSDDATPEICARLAAQDPRIHYKRQARNLGVAGNYNYLLNSARTPFFMWAAHDDLRAPTFLATCLQLLRAAPDAVACSVGVRIIDETGAEVVRVLPPRDLASPNPLDRARVVARHGAWPIYGLMRREALPADSRLGDYRRADVAFVFSMALCRRIVTTDEILNTYRLTDLPTKRKGEEAHLYEGARTGTTQMYRAMARDINRTSLQADVKARLRLRIAGLWLASARQDASDRNVWAIHRARAARRYGTVVLRLPAQLVLGPGHVVAGLRRQIAAATHR